MSHDYFDYLTPIRQTLNSASRTNVEDPAARDKLRHDLNEARQCVDAMSESRERWIRFAEVLTDVAEMFSDPMASPAKFPQLAARHKEAYDALVDAGELPPMPVFTLDATTSPQEGAEDRSTGRSGDGKAE